MCSSDLKIFFIYFSKLLEKVGGEKGGERRLWECGKPAGFSIISMAGVRGKRGR